MNTLSANRAHETRVMLKALGVRSLVFLFGVLLIILLTWFVGSIQKVPVKEIDQEFLAKEYLELSAMSDNLFGLKTSIRTYKQRMMSADITKGETPGPYLTQKQVLNWYKAREGYFRLMSDYHKMALEYNIRHQAVEYMFMYNKNLPDRNAKPLPKYYDSLD